MWVSDVEVTSVGFGVAARVCAVILRQKQNNSDQRAELSLRTLESSHIKNSHADS